MTKKENMFLRRLAQAQEDVADTIRWAEGNMHAGDYMALDMNIYKIITDKYRPKKKSLGEKLLALVVENKGETTLEQLHAMYDLFKEKAIERKAVDCEIRKLILANYSRKEASEQ